MAWHVTVAAAGLDRERVMPVSVPVVPVVMLVLVTDFKMRMAPG
jgi:hypothetical protein